MNIPKITSRKNSKIMHLKSLQNNRISREAGEILLEGPNIIKEALSQGLTVLEIFLTEEFLSKNKEWLDCGADLYLVTSAVLAKAAAVKNPRGIVARAKRETYNLADIDGKKSVLVLDGVQDPGNVGTLIRSAAAAGVEAAILLAPAADPYQPKALRASAGNVFRLPIFYFKEEEIAAGLAILDRHFFVYLAEAAKGRPYNRVNYKKPWALVLGSEVHGIRNSFYHMENITRVNIPLAGGVESLNVAVAGSVLLFSGGIPRPH